MSETDSCQGEHQSTLEPSPYTKKELDKAAALFRALSDVSRLRIVEALAQRPCCVSELVELSGDEMSTVSQRLRVLRSERLVTRRREGKHMVYSLADDHIFHLVKNALEHVAEEH